MAHPEGNLQSLTNYRSAYYEGELFANLLRSQRVVRSAEFAQLDGMICCDLAFRPEESYAMRLRRCRIASETVGSANRHRVIGFDMKSGKDHAELGRRSAHTPSSPQLRHVAFFICICARDSSFIELTPNYDQGDDETQSLEEKDWLGKTEPDDQERSYMYNSRITRLDRSVIALDPASSPYRMPKDMLPEVIELIRQCALQDKDFINPWTRARFPHWRPRMYDTATFLAPLPDSQHYSSFCALNRIHECFLAQGKDFPLIFDFVGLQPRLGDAKFIYVDQDNEAAHYTQYIIQHKLDSIPARSSKGSFARMVLSARTEEKGKTSYYFADTERFDFFFYEFRFSDGLHAFFFIPERELPDDFYTSLEKEVDFTRFLEDFYIEMDDAMRWGERISEILIRYKDHPRKSGHRPSRPPQPSKEPSKGAKESGKSQTKSVPKKQQQEDHARRAYKQTYDRTYKTFYIRFMHQCAIDKTGILFPLTNDHSCGDFAYFLFIWSDEEREAYLEHGILPLSLDHVRGDNSVVLITVFTRSKAMLYPGPTIRSAPFWRLDEFSGNRLLLFDLWGDDGMVEEEGWGPGCSSLAIIPSEDVRPTSIQRARYQQNMDVDATRERQDKTPQLSAILSTGMLPVHYIPNRPGQFIYEQPFDWEGLRKFVHCFSVDKEVRHPPSMTRDAASYRHQLGVVHEHLVEQQRRKRERAREHKKRRRAANS